MQSGDTMFKNIIIDGFRSLFFVYARRLTWFPTPVVYLLFYFVTLPLKYDVQTYSTNFYHMFAASEVLPGETQSFPVSNSVHPSFMGTVVPDIVDSISPNFQNIAIDDKEDTSNYFSSYMT